MTWQDLIISIGSIVFSIALIPMLKAKNKPPIVTSAPTALFLWLFVVVYISLRLWLSASVGCISALCWSILVIQKLRYKEGK